MADLSTSSAAFPSAKPARHHDATVTREDDDAAAPPLELGDASRGLSDLRAPPLRTDSGQPHPVLPSPTSNTDGKALPKVTSREFGPVMELVEVRRPRATDLYESPLSLCRFAAVDFDAGSGDNGGRSANGVQALELAVGFSPCLHESIPLGDVVDLMAQGFVEE